MYMGGTPLFDERTGESRERLDFVYDRHPDAKKACATAAPQNVKGIPRKEAVARPWVPPRAAGRHAATWDSRKPGCSLKLRGRDRNPPRSRRGRTRQRLARPRAHGPQAAQADGHRLRRAGRRVLGAGSLRRPGARPLLRADDVPHPGPAHPRGAEWAGYFGFEAPRRSPGTSLMLLYSVANFLVIEHPKAGPMGHVPDALLGPDGHGRADRQPAGGRRSAEPAAGHPAAVHHPVRHPLPQAAGDPAAAAGAADHHPAGPAAQPLA